MEQVVFDRLRPDSGDYDVTTVDVTTGFILKSLTASHGLDTDPTWSPDGGRIAYASNRDGRLRIYVMGRRRKSHRRLGRRRHTPVGPLLMSATDEPQAPQPPDTWRQRLKKVPVKLWALIVVPIIPIVAAAV